MNENQITLSEIISVKNKIRRAKARAEGKCTVCLKRKAKPGRTRCNYCTEQQKTYCRSLKDE